jgi:hypothetical protein
MAGTDPVTSDAADDAPVHASVDPTASVQAPVDATTPDKPLARTQDDINAVTRSPLHGFPNDTTTDQATTIHEDDRKVFEMLDKRMAEFQLQVETLKQSFREMEDGAGESDDS